ncbi:NBAS subunit of NRZ tethering complex-like isoform X2 [Procambarus clarkii]|uniref:NBAS subunit of NRZ tethering complex-like isoform X2 n=1 Tax=Procambarus clarkii TaxID=6728 RepID=UPI0037436E22
MDDSHHLHHEDNILYELLVHAEWPLEQEIIGGGTISLGGNFFYRTVTQTPANIWAVASSLWTYVRPAPAVSPSLAKLVGGRSGWQLGVGAQGAVVAILQAATLEIRAKKDDFASVVGKNSNLFVDPFPSWRRIAWSADCSMVGVSYSSGAVEIFNTLGTSIFTIYPPKYREGVPQVDASSALAALVFSDIRTQKIKWAAELIVIDYKGNVRSYFVSPTEGYQESHVFSFGKLYPSGVTAAIIHGSLLIVTGLCDFMGDSNLKNNGLGHGVTVWRMVNDYPFYKQVPTINEEEYIPPSLGLWKRLSGYRSAPHHDFIFQMCVSPTGRQLAALHTSGSLSIWELPSLRKQKFWPLLLQPHYDAVNPSSSEYIPCQKHRLIQYTGPLKNHPADLSWWSDAAVILARYSGAVTVSSVNSLRNLLGESPEFLEGVPQISEAYDRGFLGLEVESRVNSKRLLTTSNEGSDEEEYVDSDEEEELSLIQRSSRLAKNALYWVTDAERFRPPSKRSKIVQRTFRLLCLKSTTPEELFARKIENEEYGEALALANSYSLDCDRVYQQQWRRSSVTVASIQDYLAKIHKRSWVLAECVSRVPENIDAARELLMYGLRGTDLEAIIAIGNETDDGEFIPCDSDLIYDEGFDIDPSEYEIQVQERAAKEFKRKHELLMQIDFKNLTLEQKTVIRARQKLLTYLDRLATYEVLLGGAHVAPDHYDATFFDKFRSQSAISATIEFARNYDWQGVDAMFTYHGGECLPHRLAVLSNFPPTMGPFEYRSLLPECEEDEVFLWEQEELRDEDWCEDPLCREAVNEGEADPADFLYAEQPKMKKFRGVNVTAEIVSEWYQERAREIERCSHFVDAALDLLKLGRERGVEDLEELHDTLDTLEVLVYEVGHTSMTLDKYSKLSDNEKIVQLMSTSTHETYIQNIRRWLLPFLARCEKWQPGSGRSLLYTYIVNAAKQGLGLPLKILQHSRPDQHARIITSAEEMMTIAIDCVYACEKENQLPRAFAILECLPERESCPENMETLTKLHDLADSLDAHLTAAELLGNNGVNVTPCQLRQLQSHPEKVREILTKLTRAAARREPRLCDEDWRKLLYDMLELQQKVFTCVEPQMCTETMTEALLCSGVTENIQFAGELLETRVDRSPVNNPYLQQLPFAQAVKLVITAATHYCNSSESHADEAMKLAMQSLCLIESENEDIKREKDLISALQMLPDFGIHKLPLQVRLCEDRLGLIAEGLQIKKGSYRHGSRLLQLATLLRVCGTDARTRQAKVLTLVAQAALKAGDYVVASSVCEQLVSGDYHEGWLVCEQLGRAHQYANLVARARYLDFALTYATPSHLEDLLNARNEVEMAMLYAKVNTQMDTEDTTGDSDDGFVDAKSHQMDDDEENVEEDSSDEMDEQKGLLQGTLGVTRSVLSVTASTTSNLVSSVASKQFWRSAINWMQPLHELSSRGENDQLVEDTNVDFKQQGCHAFYADIIPDHHISSIGASYKSYALPSISNPALEFSLALLRIALIEETLTQGNTIKTNKTVVAEVARGVLREDLSLGLCFMLMLHQPEDARAVLASLPRTDVSLQMTQYYYALQIYTSLHPWAHPSIAPVFLHDPTEVIFHVSCIIDSLNLSRLDAELKQFIELFKSTQELVADYVQGQALQRLGAGVNIDRFLSDSSYKEDTVLGLAMTLDNEVLDLALTLAKKYEVSLWQVYMTHLQHLFDSEINTAELKKHINEKDLIQTLGNKPEEFVSRMEQNVFLTVNGCDHERLILYYSLIEQCGGMEPESKVAPSHIKLLKKLKGSAEGLNYKLLLKPNSDVLAILGPVLTAENVNNLAKVAKNVPCKEGTGIEPSTVYCAWAHKMFFESAADKKSKTSSDWIHRYESCGEYMQKMNPADIVKFVKQLVLCDAGVQPVPLEARIEFTRRAVKFCKQQQSKQKFTEEEEGWMLADDGKGWQEASAEIERWGTHLELLRSNTFQKLQRSKDPRLRSYANKFAQTGSSEPLLKELSCSVLMEGSSLDVLQEVLSVYPEGSTTTPEDVIMDTLRLLVSHWKGQDTQVNVTVKDCNHLSIFDHVLLQVHNYLEEGRDLLTEEEVLDEIRSLCNDPSVLLTTKVDVLTITEKHLSLNEEDLELVRVLRTGGVVAGAWCGEQTVTVEQEQLASNDSRAALLSLLIARTTTMQQSQALLQLLKLWPPFNHEVYMNVSSNPWLAVFDKILEIREKKLSSGLDIIWEASRDAFHLNQLPNEGLSVLVKKLQSLGREALKCSSKVALLSDDATVHGAVLQNMESIKEVKECDYDGDLLCWVITRELVPHCLPTPMYGPLVAHLVETGDNTMLKSAVQQLCDAGHYKEAASLTITQTSVPKALQTMTSALQTYKKWL